MEIWLPLFFAAAMGLALLIYVVLDGYDLGVGILLPLADEDEKDQMISSIGPFWDANETWIVLGVGILLIAFPEAHGIVLSSLYIPVTLMLMGLILRGVAFDFRVKAGDRYKRLWNFAFFAGSLLASLCQGWMLGAYITGLQFSFTGIAFSLLIALSLPALYVLLGCGWMQIKCQGLLLEKTLGWARLAVLPMGGALLLVSIATPLVSPLIAERWFSWPNLLFLSPVPLLSALCYLLILNILFKAKTRTDTGAHLLYSLLVIICLLAAAGLAYSLYPHIIIGQMTIFEAAAATKSLLFIFWGTIITLPLILMYTLYVYRIFSGKASQLSYESEEI